MNKKTNKKIFLVKKKQKRKNLSCLVLGEAVNLTKKICRLRISYRPITDDRKASEKKQTKKNFFLCILVACLVCLAEAVHLTKQKFLDVM